MCRKTISLISFFVVLSITANASAELVAYWTFDEGSGNAVYDTSGNDNNGTIYGATWGVGKYGTALQFNGQDNYVEVPSSDSLEIDDNVTIAAWINWIDTGDTWLGILANGQQNGPWENYGLFINRSSRFLYFTLSLDGGHVTQQTPNDITVPNEWVHVCASWDGSTARIYVNGKMELETVQSGTLVPPGLPLRIGHRNGSPHYFNGTIDEVRIYNHALEEAEILAAMEGGKGYPYALGPNPGNGDLYSDTWATVSWRAGDFAVSHDVYIGDNFDDVNEATRDSDLYWGNQDLEYIIVGFAGYPYPDGLVPGTTYYWRIDEVNDTEPNSPWKGNVWSFSLPPKTAYFPDPTDGAELVDLDAKLSWAAGFGAKLHYIVFGEDFDEVSNAAMGRPYGSTNYSPGPLKLAKTYYWRIDESDGFDTYKGEVWSFTTLGAASNPNPANGAVDIKPSAILKWDAGSVAASYEVYFGTDEDAVRNATTASPEYKGPKALGEENYDPGKLEFNSSYYWRIDEVNDASTDTPWAGNVWSFTTGDFFVIDDFEDYDTGENQIWYAWHDGLGYGAPGTDPYYAGNSTGAAVGDETTASYTEETIVHGGGKSMPVSYDNNKQGFAYYSEVEHKLTDQRDWTERGVGELSIWFRGISDNNAEPLYVAVSNSTGAPAVVVHDDANAAQIDTWTQWVIPLSAFADQGIVLTDVDKIVIGLGTQGNTTIPGSSGKMYFDDIRLYRSRPEPLP
jgi:hypothetical protein